jgi:molecular chaperone DnaK
MAGENKSIGRFILDGILPAPRGIPQIEVTFDIDANGILDVSAREMGTGKQANVRIEQSSGLSKDQIEKMRRDAEAHADEDKQKLELATARNEAEHMCHTLEKTMKDNADKLQDSDKEPLQKAIDSTREKAKGTDVATIKSAIEQLEAASHAFTKMLYEKSGAAGGAEGETGPGPGPQASKKSDDDVIEGEFEVKK